MNIGDSIRENRKKARLSQKELGQKLGVSQQHIAQYENGKRIPKLETIRKIADALGIYISELAVDWSMFSKEEITEDLTDYGGGFYGKEASQETQAKFAEHPFGRKAEINRKVDLLNDVGQQKAANYIEDLTKIPEYQKKPDEPPEE